MKLFKRFKGLIRETDTGQAMVEFVIVFPVQFLVILAVIQLSLLYIAHIVVNHAAFSAARAVLVFDERGGGNAQKEAEDAARIVCSSIAGTSTKQEGGGRWVTVPGWGKLLRSKGASEKTQVQIFSRDKQIVVEVTHDYELEIPVINYFFAYPWEGFLGGWSGNRGDYPGYMNNEALERKYGAPHIQIHESCYMYKPWQSEGGHP